MSHAADISGEDFFYQVLEDIEEEVEAGPSHIRQLTPDTPEYTFEEEDEDPTPSHHPLSQIPFVSIDTPSTISPLTSENPTCKPSPERCSAPIPTLLVLTLPVPITAPSLRKRLITLPLTLPNLTIHAPPIPATMTTPVFRMPLRGTDTVPKFDGTPACLIPFFEDVEQLAYYAALEHKQCIKCAIQYAPIDEAEVWVLEPEAKGKDLDKFIAVIKAMYPGCEGNRRYTCTDLENLCAEQARIPMCSKEELGQYYHKFNKISKHLINMKKLADLEQGCFFFEGIHSTTSASIKRRLEIKLADHHPDNPYSMSEVYDATVFLLPSIVTTAVPTQPTSAVAVKTQQPATQ
jgi:hypothetical protein